jgi:hypothetical protein
MSSKEFENLVKIGVLKHEPFDTKEFGGLLHTGTVRLADAKRNENALESRFDLAYNAAHAFALAALRTHGFRSEQRYAVFQALPHTLGLPVEIWRVFVRAHRLRNQVEYEGRYEATERFVRELIEATDVLLSEVRKTNR